MKKYGYNDENITFFGRTICDHVTQTTYFNWTCSGFEWITNSQKVEVELVAHIVEERGEVLYPWIAVFIDEQEEPAKCIKLTKPIGWYTLFEDLDGKNHKIRVVKRTEAQYSKTGFKQLQLTDQAQFMKVPHKENLKIEFIGDSLTCGYGNEAVAADEPFRSHQENGLKAFAAQTASRLKADFQCVSVSGIGIYSNHTLDNIEDQEVMPVVYPYTDYYVKRDLHVDTETKWDFKRFEADFIVINLGTNDWSYVCHDEVRRKEEFKKAYIQFLKQVRKLNGAKPYMICCLGVMKVGLAQTVLESVTEYKQITNDTQIEAFLFEEQNPQEDGIGAAAHPSIKTHTKMSDQLIEHILAIGSSNH